MNRERRILFFGGLILFAVAVLSSCATYGFKLVSYNETTAKVRNHEILGPITVKIEAQSMYKEEMGLRAFLIEKAKEKYGNDVDDVVNMNISHAIVSTSYSNLLIFYGDAIKYTEDM